MKRFRIVILIILAVIFCLLVSIRIAKYVTKQRLLQSNKERSLLLHEKTRLVKALEKNDISAIYSIFNATFRAEVDSQEFSSYLTTWLKGRKVKKVKLQKVMVFGRGGHITSWVSFNNNEKTFLYQSWIKTKNGWKLLWLTRILPSNLNYGATHKSEIFKIQQYSLEKLIVENEISQITGDLTVPKTILIKRIENSPKHNFRLVNRTVHELTNDEIKRTAKKYGALFYLEFGSSRIIEDIATCYVDIHPLHKNIPHLHRIRGRQLYFVRENNQWVFDSYGTKW